MRTRLTVLLLASGLMLALGPASAGAVKLSKREVRDKIAGGWVGAIIAGAWGRPTEFQYLGRTIPAHRVPGYRIARVNRYTYRGDSDETYVEIPFLDALRRNGIGAGWPEWSTAFGASRSKLFFANEYGRNNIRAGVLPPASGDPSHNPSAYDIDFQIESDFIGMAAPAQPGAAIDLAWRMGHVMNHGDGVYGGVMVSAMHATAFRARSVRRIVEAGRRAVPEGTSYRAMIEDVLRWHRRHPRDWKATWRRLERRWNAHDPAAKRTLVESEFNIDAKLNGAYILLGLLYGHGDFERTIRISMRAGQDSECNAGNAASILGTWIGRSNIPRRFREGIAYGRDFPFTDYTLRQAIAANRRLAAAVTRARGGETAGRRWRAVPSPVVAPAFEQWPLTVTDPPEVTATASPGPGGTVDFSVQASDADGVQDVWWSFGDLSGAHGSAVSHAYRAPGTYRVTVWVSDTLGRTATRELTVQAG
ncbi:MAG: ADP-ribosylglycohydrolase family protein [Actinomycetota bacterium]